jgi:hypothetical protein
VALCGPSLLLTALNPAVHGTGHRNSGSGLQQAHDDLLGSGAMAGAARKAAGSGRLGRIKGGDDVIGGQPTTGNQPRAIPPPGVDQA